MNMHVFDINHNDYTNEKTHHPYQNLPRYSVIKTNMKEIKTEEKLVKFRGNYSYK